MNGTAKSLALYVMTATFSMLALSFAVLIVLVQLARLATYSLEISELTTIVLALAFGLMFAIDLFAVRMRKWGRKG